MAYNMLNLLNKEFHKLLRWIPVEEIVYMSAEIGRNPTARIN